MGSSFSLYPTLSHELKIKLGIYHTGLKLSYQKENDTIELLLETGDSTGYTYTVSDGKNLWDPEDYELTVYKEYSLSNPKFIFGDMGVCPRNGVVGMAMIWSCKGANIRGVSRMGLVTKETPSGTAYVFEHTFPKATLRNTLDLEMILYLESAASIVSKSERHLADAEGLTLGVLDTNRIIIDGTASVFPIVTVEEPSQPLWWVNMKYSDPTEEMFSSESVSIKINKSHKDYKKLESENGVVGNALLIEIMASAVQIIVNGLKKSLYWENIRTGTEIEPGSIAEAVKYIIETYELEGLSDQEFAKTLRMKLGER